MPGLPSSATPMGPDAKMPIYLLYDVSVAGQLGKKLPQDYAAEVYVGLDDEPVAWLYKPTKRSSR